MTSIPPPDVTPAEQTLFPLGKKPAPTDNSAFFYGTLMHPRVLQRVIENDGKHLQVCSAILYSHTRYHVKDHDYPAVVPIHVGQQLSEGKDLTDDDKTVRGVLVKGLSARDMELLDVFEGDEYTRDEVSVLPLSRLYPVEDANTNDILSQSEPLPDRPSPGEMEPAFVYTWAAPISTLSPDIWSYGVFVKEKLWRWIDKDPSDEDQRDYINQRKDMGGVTIAPVGGEGQLVEAKGETAATEEQKGEIVFGHPMRKYFGFAETFVNLNNGSFGATPLPVLKYCEDINRNAEERPDKFFRAAYKPILNTARERVAKMIHAEADECVIVPNVTHGINTVLYNFTWKKEDIVIGFSTTYNAIHQTLQQLSDREPHPTYSIIPLAFPTTHAEILTLFRNHIRSLPRSEGQTVVAVIDTIVSNPGVTMPWEKLVEICKEENVWSLIDAAHGLGILDTDLSKTQPDFWVSNAYKWLMSKRGSAVLYVPCRHHHLIRTSFPTSWGYISPPASNTLAGIFEFTGTTDVAPYLSINAAIDFRESIGGEQKIQDYCNALALKGGQRLAEVLGTEVMGNTEELANHMINVRLPLNEECPGSFLQHLPTAIAVMEDLMVKHDCFAAVFAHAGKWWVRASTQIWNEVSDFEYVGQALKQICADKNRITQ